MGNQSARTGREFYKSVEAMYDGLARDGLEELGIARGIYSNAPEEIKDRIELMEEELANFTIRGFRGLMLDAGCGNGNILMRMHKLEADARFIGIDLSSQMLCRAKQRLFINSIILGFTQANVVQLPFRDGSFEGISCLEVLIYMPSKKVLLSVIDEFCRILKPGGVLVISTVNNTLSLRGMIAQLILKFLHSRSPGFQALHSSIWILTQLRRRKLRVECYRGWNRPVVNRSRLYWLNRLMSPIDSVHNRLCALFPSLHLLKDRVAFRCVKMD